MANYISEFTDFINTLYNKDKNLFQKQLKSRNTWWDKDYIDEDQQKEFAKSKVITDNYVYYSYEHDAKN